MSIGAMAGRLMTVYRRTALVKDSTALVSGAISVALDRQPAAAAHVAVVVTGATSFGTFTVNGLVGGVPTSEVLTFTADGSQETVARFDAGSLTTIDGAGWSAAGSWLARAVGSDGSRVHGRYSVATSVRCHLNRGPARWLNGAPGVAQVEPTWIAHDWTSAWTPREGDVYVDQGTSEEWRVIGTPDWLGSNRPHHWEVRVKRREGSLDT